MVILFDFLNLGAVQIGEEVDSFIRAGLFVQLAYIKGLKRKLFTISNKQRQKHRITNYIHKLFSWVSHVRYRLHYEKGRTLPYSP